MADTRTTRPQRERRVDRPASGTDDTLKGTPARGHSCPAGVSLRTRRGMPVVADHRTGEAFDGSHDAGGGLGAAPEGAAPAPHDDDLAGRGDRRRPVRGQRRGDERHGPGRDPLLPRRGPARRADHADAGRDGGRQPHVGSFMEYCRQALGPWAGFSVGWLYWYFWAIVLAVEAVAGAEILRNWLPGIPMWLMSLRADDRADGDEPVVGALVRRVRVLVRVDQGRGDPRVHRHRRSAGCSGSAAATRPGCPT